tara:strand:- start:979 stop:1875 length:897 start_codon:yes stop_codon:yes gene_type:complete
MADKKEMTFTEAAKQIEKLLADDKSDFFRDDAHRESYKKLAQQYRQLDDPNLTPEEMKKALEEQAIRDMDRNMQKAAEKHSRRKLLVGGQEKLDANKDGKISGEDFKMLQEREKKADGSLMMPSEGMPVDTYPNIPPDEMEEVMASQLPDNEMEEDYIKFVMDESLDDNEQNYLAEVLTKDPRLSDILDKVITTASEFSGAGEVDGPGTGVSDSIPARLSDGEFVFTRKATDQLGADNLQIMMDDAERAYDGGLQQMNVGGMPRQDEEELEEDRFDMSKTDEEIKKLMIGANKMPSVQ